MLRRAKKRVTCSLAQWSDSWFTRGRINVLPSGRIVFPPMKLDCFLQGNRSMRMLIPSPHLFLPPPFPFDNHKFIFYVCGSIFVLQISSFVIIFFDSTCKWCHIFVFLCLACGLTHAYYYSWASLMAHWVKNLPAMQERLRFSSWVGKISWRRAWQPTPVFLFGESHGQRSWRATVQRVTKSWTQHTHTHTHYYI